MNSEQLKDLEKELWSAADTLRANSKLTAAEYKDPVLGLIFLRFAYNNYKEAEQNLGLPINPRTGLMRAATKDDFKASNVLFLPDAAKYKYLANLPESEDVSDVINNAMRLVESDNKNLLGVLPKNYQDLESDLLKELIRVFNTEAVRSIKGDAFGQIYEFFLMKFSISGAGAQEGGEFFTPPSLVGLIVNFIEPDRGIIHDPACGSGGMFVQTGHFVQNHTNKSVNEAITVYGTELKTNNTKLAKMNLAIHGIEGTIIEDNSFYSNPHDLTGKCDFIMANPPFNVDKIDKNKEFIKGDSRLPFGTPTKDNGNYMWIQYFHSYLNDNGRAGFVMASSAADAGKSEKNIRQKLLETGDIEAIVSVATNFFYGKFNGPCHIWFLNKNKQDKDTILMLNAKNTFRKATTTINDFSLDQLEGLTTIIKSYRGKSVNFTANKWLIDNFKNGTYEDVIGLCKVAKMDEIIENEYSLNPGRYVGFNINFDQNFDYKSKISEVHNEIDRLSTESDLHIDAIRELKL